VKPTDLFVSLERALPYGVFNQVLKPSVQVLAYGLVPCVVSDANFAAGDRLRQLAPHLCPGLAAEGLTLAPFVCIDDVLSVPASVLAAMDRSFSVSYARVDLATGGERETILNRMERLSAGMGTIFARREGALVLERS